MMSEEQAQKFGHTDDMSLPRKFASTNQKHHTDLGSDASSV